MNAFNPCETLAESLGGLFQCSRHERFIRIRTPYLYPDGDIVDLFCRFDDGGGIVTDLGETIRWLRMQTTASRRSPRQQALIEDICLTHGIEFFKGMLRVGYTNELELAGAVFRLSQAVLRVSDLWFTFRTRAMESVADEVSEFLIERKFPFSRGDKLKGRSGRLWAVDFTVTSPSRSSLIQVLSTGSRSAARAISEHVLTSWYDLSVLTLGPTVYRFLSLFDDTIDVWTGEDFKLLESLSTIIRWSEPDRFADELTKAA